MKYGNDFVDEKYSSILEPNLFADTVMIPGITYNPDFEGEVDAGLVHIYKENKGDRKDPEAPAGDFNDENSGNNLIDLRLNNAYRKSKKIYQVTANSCSYSKAEVNLSLAVAENKESRQASALACLVNEGTLIESTKTKISQKVIELRKELRKKHAKPDIVFATVEAYAQMLEEAGDKYTPVTNDKIITTGQVGKYLGMTWFEVDAFEGIAKYFDHTGEKREVNLQEVELVVYDHTALHLADNLNMMRLADTTKFTGVLAQNEINSGFRVSNSDKVAVIKTTATVQTHAETQNEGQDNPQTNP